MHIWVAPIQPWTIDIFGAVDVFMPMHGYKLFEIAVCFLFCPSHWCGGKSCWN